MKSEKTRLVRKEYRTEYYTWKSMRYRCTKSSFWAYPYYGGRGIVVCERWRDSFENFIEDMGKKPSPKLTIERIDVNGNYELSNCRWATRKEQAGNTRRNRWLTYNGKTMIATDWAAHIGMSKGGLLARIDKLGWSIEDALTKPAGQKYRPDSTIIRRYENGRFVKGAHYKQKEINEN